MRIIAGKYRGRKLLEFKGRDIRPTSDKAREAFFSIIQNRTPNSEFLDLFAGTGCMGFEALSRGAKTVVMSDSSKAACALIEQNAEKLGVNVELYGVPAMYVLNKLIANKRQFDIIFLDPPYATNYGEEALNIISKNNLLKDDGIAVFETDKHNNDIKNIENLELVYEKSYGKARFLFYKNESE